MRVHTRSIIPSYICTKLKNSGGIALFISNVTELISTTTGTGVSSLGAKLISVEICEISPILRQPQK